MRRILVVIVVCIAVLVAALSALWFSPQLQDAVIARMAREHLKADRSDLLADGALHIVLCGTGSPLADPERASACTAVIAAGHIVLIDIGSGATARLAEARIPLERVDAVVLTHLHSDHIGDLGNLALQGWIAGRKRPLDVYGPQGTDTVVTGFGQVFKADAGFRIAHHGADYLIPAGDEVNAHIISAPGPRDAVPVYARDGLVITAFLVDHYPVTPAFGYRIAYKGRVVVVSGDTKKNDNVQRYAQGADLLVHEALSSHLVLQLAKALDASGDHRRAKMFRDTITYHTSPVDAAAIARADHVGLLVFTHIVPPLPNVLARHIFLSGVRDAAGNVPTVLGHDGLMLTLPPGTTAITQDDLL